MEEIPERLRAELSDRYPIERELGRGGMATVYLCQDRKHQRLVALKVLHPELAAVLGADRFLREIEIAAQFAHPNILPLYDSGAAGGYLYYVMPFVDGESLRDRLTREVQLPVPDTLRITRDVADALGYAHSRGVIHRDIKPENILLSGSHALVADFGIARAMSAVAGDKLTQTGFAIGTPAYMSPEQSAGEAVDGRSDLYSLGCVMYEMLAGESPFTGRTAQAISARRMIETPRPIRTIREAVPESMDAMLRTMLSRTPADRFATAAQFGAALDAVGLAEADKGGSPALIPVVSAGRKRILVPLLAVAIVGLLLIWRYIGRHPEASTLDHDLIAVAPFNVLDPTLGLWREGLMDQLSKDLDGAGALRTVAPSTFVSHWKGQGDRGSAESLGRSTGAGLVIFGDLSQEGPEALRLRASLLETGEARPPIEVEVHGPASTLGVMVDSLAVHLLSALGQRRPVAAVRQSLLGGQPLPALKEYLQGEQLYRRLQYDSALVHYSRAITADSGFALAYRRMSLVLSFSPPTQGAYQDFATYGYQAAALNHGLSPRDSLLIVGDSLLWALTGETSWLRARLLAIRRETAQLYPGDPEAWVALGEAYQHTGDFPPSSPLEAFERAIALDSAFAPAYEHVFQDAVRSGRPEHAVTLLRAFSRHIPPTVRGGFVGPLPLAAALIDSAGHPTLAGLAATDTSDVLVVVNTAVNFFGSLPDSSETSVALARRLMAGRVKLRNESGEPSAPSRFLAWALTNRGHLAEAYARFPHFPLDRWHPEFDRYAEQALLDAVPADSAAATFARVLAMEPFPGVVLARGMPWWLTHGDSASLLRMAERSEAAARTSGGADQMALVADVREARAYVSLIRGDSSSALRQLQAIPDTICIDCARRILVQARLLAAAHQEQEALDLLDRFFYHDMDPLSVLAMLERARLAETVGERDRAIDAYQFVLDTWRHADTGLQKYVAEAREALGRLGGEPGS